MDEGGRRRRHLSEGTDSIPSSLEPLAPDLKWDTVTHKRKRTNIVLDETPGTSGTSGGAKKKSNQISSRLRVYPEDSTGTSWSVYFQPTTKPLNVVKIGKDLAARFPKGIAFISKVNKKRLRVVVDSWNLANDIVRCEHFSKEYRVYIPANAVEIDGVVTEEGLTCDVLRNEGLGRFKKPGLPQVKIIECQQLYKASLDDAGNKAYHPSNSFRVTFAGKALPNNVVIGKVHLPVRPFVPRTMYCLHCYRLGHTASHCSNKARCGKCGENHVTDSCGKLAQKCLFCGQDGEHDISTCPAYKSRSEVKKQQLKASIKRSYAEIVQKAASSAQQNAFSLLPDDESDYDESDVGVSFASQASTGKRKNPSSPGLPRKGLKITNIAMPKRGSADQNPKQVPPGFRNYNLQFPALPGTQETPTVPFSQSENRPKTGLFAFSDIVDNLLNAFNASDSIRSILLALLPLVKSLLQQLTVKWPLLAAIISFDG